jgi:hypothetical protein
MDQPSVLAAARAAQVLRGLKASCEQQRLAGRLAPMTAPYPGDAVLTLVGERLGSPLVHRTARHPGLKSRETTIFGTSDPVATDQQYAHNLAQPVLRSESESHFPAPDWPTSARLDAWPQKSPKPLWRTRSERVGCLPGSGRPAALLSPALGAARVGECRRP